MIHPTAVVSPDVQLGSGVEIGAYSIVGRGVEIGDGTVISHHVSIEGPTRIGANNRIYPFCSIGGSPQDKKYSNEPTRLEIGDGNTIREFCTFNRGTIQDGSVTRVGNDNWIMAYVHVAHDCQIGNHTIFANNAQMAGHVVVSDHAILGGFTVVHQFVRIGAHSLTAMGTILLQDLPPYVTAAGNTARPFGINNEGLKRRGFDPESISAIKRAYKTIYKSGLSLQAAKGILAAQSAKFPEIEVLLAFLERSTRGIIR